MIAVVRIMFGILFILATLPSCLYMRISFTPLFGLEFIYWFLFPSLLFVSGIGVLSIKRWAFYTMTAAGIILFSALVDYYVIGLDVGSTGGWQMVNLLKYPHPHQTSILLSILCPLLFFAFPKVRQHFNEADKVDLPHRRKLDLNKSFIFAFFLLICFAKVTFAQQALPLPPGQDNQQIIVKAASICTEMACPLDNLCCNTCSFRGWYVQNTEITVQSLERPFPNCFPDGCGTCPFYIQARGYFDNPDNPFVFYATYWIQVGGEATVPPPDGIDRTEEIDEEEQQKALKEWMDQIKAENEERMEKLKKEDPAQHQQYQKFIDLFKNIQNQGTSEGGNN